MNPELLRNLWLEITPRRLLAMPAVLGLVFAAAFAAGGPAATALYARWIGLGIGVVWGARQAAGAVAGEIAQRTWDGQRASALTPWQMSWGKLAGAPALAWYGVALCLGVQLAAGGGLGAAAEMLVATGLSHATALFASLVLIALGGRTVALTGLPHLAGILAGLAPLVPAADLLGLPGWYGLAALPDDGVRLASFAAFWAWAVLGVWRLMMGELAAPQRPWAWPAFTLFAALHAGGFVWHRGAVAALDMACLVATLLALAAALAEPKHRAPMLRLLAGRLRAAPPSLQSLALAAAMAVAHLLQGGAAAPLGGQEPAVQPLALVLFVARDVALIRLVSLGRGGMQGAAAAIVWLAVLYAVLPGLAGALGLSAAFALLLPLATPGLGLLTGVAILAPALQALVLWLLFARRLAGARPPERQRIRFRDDTV